MRGQKHPSSVQEAIGVVLVSIPAFLFFWFVRGDLTTRICAAVVFPLLDIWFVAAIFREKHADKKAAQKKLDYLSGDYFCDPAWREEYLRRKYEHGYEACHPKGMRYDMMQRYRRRSEPVTLMLLLGFLLFCCIVALVSVREWIALAGIPLFVWLFWLELSEFTARPVRKWLRAYRDKPELAAFQKSWEHGRILSYQRSGVSNGIWSQRSGVVNGICLSPAHIILYNNKEVHTVEMSVAEAMTREIVREKTYHNNAYADEHYRFYVVLHIRTEQGESILKTELDEYQTEMAIEEFERLKGQRAGQTDVTEHSIYVTVT